MTPARTDRLGATLVGAGLLLSSGASADVDLHLTIASGYLHRGLEYTRSGPAYQAALEYHSGNWFAGLWSGNVSFGAYDERHTEIDGYLGYSRRWSGALAMEATLIHYTFHGGSPRHDDWTELQISAYLGDRWTLTWGIADNWWATEARTRVVEGTFRQPLPARLILDATVGYQLAERAAGVNYGYAETGISRRLQDFVLRFGYAAVGADARDRFAGIADDRWIASITWQL